MVTMMLSRTILIFSLFSLFCFSTLADSLFIGTAKTVQGKVTIQKNSMPFNAKLNDKIYEGDVIETESSGNIGLLFIDGTQLSIGPNSQVVINRYLFLPKEKIYAFDIILNNGSAIYTSGKLGALSPESIKVQTPEATIGVRGTKFLVEVD